MAKKDERVTWHNYSLQRQLNYVPGLSARLSLLFGHYDVALFRALLQLGWYETCRGHLEP